MIEKTATQNGKWFSDVMGVEVCAMKLRTYYLLSWLSGMITLVFSIGGALAFLTYLSTPSTVDGIVRKGHMSLMEFILPLCLIALLCFVLYLCLSVFCLFRKRREKEHRILHFLLGLLLYLITTAGTVPLLILLLN